MTEHPITPTAELVQQWLSEHFGYELSLHESSSLVTYSEITTKAARWGADQELEACVEWLGKTQWCEPGGKCLSDLRAARRPQPPSLKQQALDGLRSIECNFPQSQRAFEESCELIRSALESLPD